MILGDQWADFYFNGKCISFHVYQGKECTIVSNPSFFRNYYSDQDSFYIYLNVFCSESIYRKILVKSTGEGLPWWLSG